MSGSGDSGSSGASFETIQFKNECTRAGDIWAAIRYQDTNNAWKTAGFWKIAPGQTVTAAHTRNRIYYVYAYNQNSVKVWSGDEGPWTLYGKSHRYLKILASFNSSNYGTWTQRFTCN